MSLIIQQFHIIPCKLIEILHLRIQPELRRRQRLAAYQLFNKRYVPVVNVRVRDHMDELYWHTFQLLAVSTSFERWFKIPFSVSLSCPALFVTLNVML